MKAQSIGQVWGGIRIYDAANAGQVFAALHDFVPGGVNDAKAAIILTNVDAVGGITTILIFYFYDGATPPSEGPFADFLKIPFILDTTKTRNYSDLVSYLG
jgi:hypothetical protein